jgi:hypothetical protein
MTLHVITTCESREHPTSLVSAHVKHKFDTNVTEKVTTLFKNSVSCKFFLFLALRARYLDSRKNGPGPIWSLDNKGPVKSVGHVLRGYNDGFLN